MITPVGQFSGAVLLSSGHWKARSVHWCTTTLGCLDFLGQFSTSGHWKARSFHCCTTALGCLDYLSTNSVATELHSKKKITQHTKSLLNSEVRSQDHCMLLFTECFCWCCITAVCRLYRLTAYKVMADFIYLVTCQVYSTFTLETGNTISRSIIHCSQTLRAGLLQTDRHSSLFTSKKGKYFSSS